MKKSKMKLLVGITIFLGMLTFPSELVNASTTQILDNDDLSGKNATYGKWAYKNYKGDYNGDHRQAVSDIGVIMREYHWKFNGSNSKKKDFYVYLNNPAFKNTYATYHVRNKGATTYLGTVNQDKAPGGWNKINSKPFTKAGTYLQVHTSSGMNRLTGADAAKIIKY